MNNFSCYANAPIDWVKVLSLLGIAHDKHVLPAKTCCPACKGYRLLIFPNKRLTGQWHYCQDCQTRGSIVELFANTRKMDLTTAIDRLFAEGLLAPTLSKKKRKAFTERLIARLTQQAKIHAIHLAYPERVTTSHKISKMLNKLSLNPSCTPEEFKQGFGKVIFGIDAYDFEFVIAPASVAWTRRKSEIAETQGYVDRNNDRCTFSGEWGDVIGVPYFNGPGWVGAFQFMGRRLYPETDMPYKRINKSDPGLAANYELFDKRPAAIVAVQSLDAYLKLQSSYYAAKGKKPLPLVTWFDKDNVRTKSHSWEYFSPCKKVFWCPGLTSSVLTQAVENNGFIYEADLTDTSDAGVRFYLKDRTTEQNIANWIKRAKPWVEVLEQFVRHEPVSSVENLIRGALLKGLDRLMLLSPLSKEARRIIDKAMAPVSTVLEIRFGAQNKYVSVDTTGWNVDGEFITNAPFFIDKAMYSAQKDCVVYYGHVMFKGQRAEFTFEGNLATAPISDILTKLLVKNKLGVPLFKWPDKKLMQICMQLSDLVVVESLDTVGWNGTSKVFDFVKFKLNNSGDVVPQNKVTVTSSYPTSCLCLPENIPLAKIEKAFEITPENKVFWSMFGYAAHTAVSDIFGYTRSALTVVPEIAQCTNQSLQVLGGLHNSISTHTLDRAVILADTSNWVTGLGLTDKPQRELLRQLLNKVSSRASIVVKATKKQQLLLATQGCHGISGECGKLTDSLISYASVLLPNYLQDLLKRNSVLTCGEGSSIRLVFDDIIAWLGRLNLNQEVVSLSFSDFLDATSNRSDVVGEMFANMLIEGYVHLVPKDFGSPNVSFVRIGNNIFVPKPLFVSATEKDTGLCVSLEDITKHLTDGKALVNEIELQSVSGWVIKEAWLNNFIKSAKAKASKLHVAQ